LVDKFSPEFRSRIMARVRGKNTSPELTVRKIVHGLGYRFRLHRRDLPGIPDIVLPRHRKIIFVHGCFWHGHPYCKRSGRPKSNVIFWKRKIRENIARDQKTLKGLHLLGWRPLIIWECEIKNHDMLLKKLKRFL
jgi:DNA mismatch endonuclease (patch repair protein)